MNKLFTSYYKFIFYISIFSISSLFVIEHTAKKFNFNIKPSILIKYAADNSILIWQKIGIFFANISSFYTFIKFGELYETLLDLLIPIIHLLISPLNFINGYLAVAIKYKYPALIGLGSLTLLGILNYLYWKYNGRS